MVEAFVQNFRLKTTVDGEIQAQKYAERARRAMRSARRSGAKAH